MAVLTLADHLDALSRARGARPWLLRFQLGLSTRATERVFTLVAPKQGLSAALARLHNGILLLHPAAAAIEGPVDPGIVDEALQALRELHGVPLTAGPPTGRAPLRPSVPAVTAPTQPASGEGLGLGLDIGGTGMKACLLAGERVVAQDQAPTWPDGEQGLDSLVRRARGLLGGLLEEGQAASLGIGFASPMGVDGRVHSLSTVMRERLGTAEGLERFGDRVAEGIVAGPVVVYNDLAVLGRDCSARGARRYLRLQIGTSFGGCWVDADGTVNAGELGRLRIDMSPDARPHTYLPLSGAMKSYLSNYGVAWSLSEALGRPISPAEAGFVLAEQLGRDPGQRTLDELTTLLVGVVREARALLPGLREVEVGGGMLRDATGRRLQRAVREALATREHAPGFAVARDPGFDGAVAAARAPRAQVRLRGRRRVG